MQAQGQLLIVRTTTAMAVMLRIAANDATTILLSTIDGVIYYRFSAECELNIGDFISDTSTNKCPLLCEAALKRIS